MVRSRAPRGGRRALAASLASLIPLRGVETLLFSSLLPGHDLPSRVTTSLHVLTRFWNLVLLVETFTKSQALTGQRCCSLSVGSWDAAGDASLPPEMVGRVLTDSVETRAIQARVPSEKFCLVPRQTCWPWENQYK